MSIDTKTLVGKGLIHGMSNKAYHETDAVGSSQLGMIEKSCAVFENRKEFTYSIPAFNTGTLLHSAILEPHTVDNMFMESPTKGLDTKPALAAARENPDKIIVGQGAIDDAKEAARKVHLIYGDWLDKAVKEASLFYEDEVYGITRKVRPDALIEDMGIVFDIKSTSERSPKDFAKSIERYKYHRQAAYYKDTLNKAGIRVDIVALIVVPTSGDGAPYGFSFSDESILKGTLDFEALLGEYVNYKQDGTDRLFKEFHTWEWISEQRELGLPID